MPYIKKERRPLFEESINNIVFNLGKIEENIFDEDIAKGDLNYVISSIIKRYIDKHGWRYHRLNDFVGGVLTCCQLELYRRFAAPYEDKAIQKNGDI